MADTLTTTSTLDNLLPVYFERKALPRLEKKAVLYSLCDMKMPLPRANGKTVQWNGWSNFAPVSASLTEGTNASLAAVSSRKVTATVSQYGRGVKTTDLVEYTSSLDVIQGTVDNLAYSAGLSVDLVVQTAIFRATLAKNAGNTILSAWMSAVTSAFHAGSNAAATSGTNTWGFPVVFGASVARLSAVSKTAPSTSAQASLFAIRKTVNQLREKNAMEFADGYFKMVVRTSFMTGLMTDPAYKEWVKYTNTQSMEKAEAIAPVEGVRVYQSNNLPKYRATAHSCDVSFVFGQGAYGCVQMNAGKGNGFEIIIKRPGPQSTDNPGDMYSTLFYKFTMAAAALNVSCGRILFTHVK